MEYKRGRYSWLLKPFLVLFDLSIINVLAFYSFNFNEENLYFFSSSFFNNKHILYVIYSCVFWLLSTSLISFYRVYRYTSTLNILLLLIKQFLIFSFLFYAFLGVFRSINIQAFVTFEYLVSSFIVIGLVKLLCYYLLKAYRVKLKGNLRRVVIVGNTEGANELKSIFIKKKDLGYTLVAHFSNKLDDDISGTIKESFSFLEANNGIDEIYCAVDELTENQINNFVKFANLHHCNIKFIQETKKLFSKRLNTDFFNYLPIHSIQQAALNHDFNKIVKRTFDVIFSILILIFILSWVSIILFVLIKLESKGPLFYKHKRNGINYKEFTCYKFRSLRTIKEVKGTYVQQNDTRVTKIGKFLRHTSIDELPQFYNVILGDMSVVGPRPHMLSYTKAYSKKIDKYNFIFRHHVKPGITGLAQIKGYRGEIKSDQDIINRIKFDNFYIENWSLLLDIKIILQTTLNVFKGQKQAY